VCAEFCGAGHAEMRFTVVAHEPGQYPAALAEAVARQGRAEAAAQAGGKPKGAP
jgi:cytochrome c oxidase subunit 2